jgi:hypothetical protein
VLVGLIFLALLLRGGKTATSLWENRPWREDAKVRYWTAGQILWLTFSLKSRIKN